MLDSGMERVRESLSERVANVLQELVPSIDETIKVLENLGSSFAKSNAGSRERLIRQVVDSALPPGAR